MAPPFHSFVTTLVCASLVPSTSQAVLVSTQLASVHDIPGASTYGYESAPAVQIAPSDMCDLHWQKFPLPAC